jgi:heme exporter protein C
MAARAMSKNWWKALAIILIFYSIIAGFLGDVPRRVILNETIRNLYFHVSMWFAMISMMAVSLVYSIRYLAGNKLQFDDRACLFAEMGLVFSFLGIITGAVWAKFTWGAFWTNDAKLNGTAITILIYLAYFILRGSLDDRDKKARLAAVYNVFAFVLMIVFIGILPRLTDSLHPGNGGNPAFSQYDLDDNMRRVFYPAVIGWILFGIWVAQIRYRMATIKLQIEQWRNDSLDQLH